MASFVIDTKGLVDLNEELIQNEEDDSGNEVEESDLEEEKPSLEILQDSTNPDDQSQSDNEDTSSEDDSTSEDEAWDEETVQQATTTQRRRAVPWHREEVTMKEEDDDCLVLPPGSDSDEDEPTIITTIPRMLKQAKKPDTSEKKKKGDYDLNDVYIDYANAHSEGHYVTEALKAERRKNLNKLLKEKSIAYAPGLEQMESVPNQNISDRKLKKQRKTERAKTKGDSWFNMPATEVTEEVKRDLEVLQMRSILDPKTFYKKNDLKVLPKYFQVGHIEDNAADFYHSRIPNRERKRTMVDELLADAEFQRRSKAKFKEIVVEQKKSQPRAFRHAKKLKRRKK